MWREPVFSWHDYSRAQPSSVVQQHRASSFVCAFRQLKSFSQEAAERELRAAGLAEVREAALVTWHT